MSNMSDFLENGLIDHLFRTASFAKPAALHVALFTAAPGDAGGGTEVSGGNYSRVNLAPADANWAAPASGNGQTSNAVAITFPAPTANWGTITHFAIFDAATAGNLITYGALTAAKTVNNGDPAPSFAVGALVITLA